MLLAHPAYDIRTTKRFNSINKSEIHFFSNRMNILRIYANKYRFERNSITLSQWKRKARKHLNVISSIGLKEIIYLFIFYSPIVLYANLKPNLLVLHYSVHEAFSQRYPFYFMIYWTQIHESILWVYFTIIWFIS